MIEEQAKSVNAQSQWSFKVSPRETLIRYMPYLPWVLLSIIIALSLAVVKIRYTPEVYEVSGTILIRNENSFSAKAEKFDDLLLTDNKSDLEDEKQVIKSTGTARRVVKALNLEYRYFNKGKIRSTELRADECPFTLHVLLLKDSASNFSLPIQIVDETRFRIAEKGDALYFGSVFETKDGTFRLDRTGDKLSSYSSNMFTVQYSPNDQRAVELAGSFAANRSGESNNILLLSMETENPRLGEEVVNQWMKEYQVAGLEEKRQTAVNALSFIDNQMDTVRLELGGVEKNLLGFRERNNVVNPQQQSVLMFEKMSELDRAITEQGVKMQVLNNLIKYISDDKNPYRQVGSALGIEEPSLVVQIAEFNKLQLQRETLLKTTTRNNPIVINAEASIEKLRVDMIQNLINIRQAYQTSFNSLTEKSRTFGGEVSRIPAKEKELLDITRRQKILEELYSFLLQKKLETSISSASTISAVKVLERARSTSYPVKPNKRGILTMAFFIGLLIPASIIFLRDYLNDKINDRDDILKVTSVPIVGELGHSEEKTPLVVSKNSRRFIAEQFRMLRTNLQYIVPQKEKFVLQVTSSVSGEGKSFVSTNIAAVMALTGKKTALLEFDIRKPKIISTLGMQRKSGITNYIIGKTAFEELPIKMAGVDNLDIIPCGPIPPNPSELLLDPRLAELFERVKEVYDVVIVDTAPVGLVSDAIVLGKYADATLYIIRHNYTIKKQLQLLDDMFTNAKLPKVSVVINDVSTNGGYGRYYGYGGYGYSGYGYGGEYFDDAKPAGGFWESVKGLLPLKRR